MRDNDGRRLDHETLEALRLRAVSQVNAGTRPAEVAGALGLSRSVVYRWLAAYRDGGRGALLARPVPGRPPRLSVLQMRQLWGLIVGSDPRQLQFDFALWTREMVRELIRREFGVGLSVVSVGRLLARMGLSPQRPLYRACQQDPEAVTRWKEQEYPAIAARARALGAAVWFCGEAGIRSEYHAGTTWAPAGQTPVVKVTGARSSVNLISAVSAKGALRFAVFDGTTTTASFIAFCKRLVHDAPGPVFLVVDGHPAHRSRAVRTWVASTAGRLELHYLPGQPGGVSPQVGNFSKQVRGISGECHQRAATGAVRQGRVAGRGLADPERVPGGAGG